MWRRHLLTSDAQTKHSLIGKPLCAWTLTIPFLRKSSHYSTSTYIGTSKRISACETTSKPSRRTNSCATYWLVYKRGSNSLLARHQLIDLLGDSWPIRALRQLPRVLVQPFQLVKKANSSVHLTIAPS